MTSYTSCRGCLVDRFKCEHRKRIQTAISGLHVTSLKFSCAERLSRFRPGQRVTVMWKFLNEFDDCLEEVLFKATVLGEPKPGRFHIRVDDGPCHFCDNEPEEFTAPDCLIGNGFATATYSRLTALDEPDRPICAECGGLGDKSDCWGGIRSDACLLHQSET